MTIALDVPFSASYNVPMHPDVRTRLDSDIDIVFGMLNRTDWYVP